MKLHMEYKKDGWDTRQDMELPDDEKLDARILGSVKRYLAEKEKGAAVSPLRQASPATSPVGGGKDGETASPATCGGEGDGTAASAAGGKDGGTASPATPCGKYEGTNAEAVPAQEEKPGSERYGGMLICECGSCHKTRAFTSKYPLSHYKCQECGEKTELTMMADVELTCLTCGKTWHYRTNSMEASVEANCPKCGKLLVGWWDKKGKVYRND